MTGRIAVAALAAAAGLLAGCGGDAAAADRDSQPDPDPVTLRVVIPDGNLREPGTPCSGAHGFRYAHAEAPYAVRDGSGREVATGVLPEGTAEQAYNLDLGEGRQPTVCVITVEVAGVTTLDGHDLVIDDRAPVPIEPNPRLAGAPEVVLR
ncbi:MAG TPA: hypothetical protein VIL37_14155 [Natronosporangium sp.]